MNWKSHQTFLYLWFIQYSSKSYLLIKIYVQIYLFTCLIEYFKFPINKMMESSLGYFTVDFKFDPTLCYSDNILSFECINERSSVKSKITFRLTPLWGLVWTRRVTRSPKRRLHLSVSTNVPSPYLHQSQVELHQSKYTISNTVNIP